MAPTPEEFIARWSPSGGSERANYALFLSELCDVLGVKRPEVSTTAGSGEYVFEREVREVFTDGTSTPRFLDLYRKGSFVLEAKQGVEPEEQQGELARATSGKKARKKRGHGVRGIRSYDSAMVKAKAQAEAYARFLPATEGRPPFVLVADVSHTIEVYSEFTRTGGSYLPFPDARSHRIPLTELAKEETRVLLRTIWDKPLSLDPAQFAALTTREVAGKLAGVGQSLGLEKNEKGKPTFSAGQISAFLMRMIFTMFAEDMDLIPKGKFTGGLRSLRDDPAGPDLAGFVPLIGELWGHMAKGGYSTFLRATILHFNGGLFGVTTRSILVAKSELSGWRGKIRVVSVYSRESAHWAMGLHPQPWGDIPEETPRVARASFPKGNAIMRLRDEFGALYQDQDFAALFPRHG